jgi:protease PrsW
MIFWNIAVAVLPIILVCAFIYYQDKYEKESAFVLFKCFVLGMVCVIPAYYLEFLGKTFTKIDFPIVYIFLVVAVAEELFKFLILRYYFFKDSEFNEPIDGIVYATFMSMGFAFVENLGYAYSYGLANSLVRAFTAIPAHATYGVMMGYFLGLAKFKSDKTIQYLLTSFLSAWFLHGVYDYIVSQYDNDFIAAYIIPLIIISLIYSYKMIVENREISPFRK